jgi:hypothetical protein
LSEDSKGLYLIGGYGRNRLILDNVEYICLETMKATELQPMPAKVCSPAACFFNGRLFVIKSQICVYQPSLKSWSKIDDVELPKHIEFNRAMVHGNFIYLTGNHSYELFRFNPDWKISDHDGSNVCQPEHELKFLGKFSNEVQNVCVVEDNIFNFSTDQFEYNSTIEKYDLKTGKFNVVWEKETDAFDFSPFHSSGCFPLIIY